MKQKRGSAYDIDRLKRDFPEVHKDLQAGIYRSPRAAAIAAGIKKNTTPLTILKREWAKATPAQRREFQKLIGSPAIAPISATSPPIILDTNRMLLPAIATQIKGIMAARKLKTGMLMKEMGLGVHDVSISYVMGRHGPVRLKLEAAIQKWLPKQ